VAEQFCLCNDKRCVFNEAGIKVFSIIMLQKLIYNSRLPVALQLYIFFTSVLYTSNKQIQK